MSIRKWTIRTALVASVVAGIIYADHAIEGLYATYEVQVVERTSWADYQAYVALEAKNKEEVSKQAVKTAQSKKFIHAVIKSQPSRDEISSLVRF